MRAIKFLRQRDDISCGPTCAYMVAEAFGKRGKRKALRRWLKTDKNLGTHQKDLIAGFRRVGLRSNVWSFAADYPGEQLLAGLLQDAFDSNDLVVACVDNSEHWIVLRGIVGKRIYVADPDNEIRYHTLRKLTERLRNGSLVFVGL